MLNRLHHSGRLDELAEDVLQNVFGVVDVGHSLPDEVSQPVLLGPDRVGDLSVSAVTSIARTA